MWIDKIDYTAMAQGIQYFSGKDCTPERAKKIVVSIILADSTFERLDLEGKMLRLNSKLNDIYATIPQLINIRNKEMPVCSESRNERRRKKKK